MNITQDITLEGVELRVDCDCYPASRGAREAGTGLQLEPDEPRTCEVTAVYVADVDIADLLSAGRLEQCRNTVVEQLDANGEPDFDEDRGR